MWTSCCAGVGCHFLAAQPWLWPCKTATPSSRWIPGGLAIIDVTSPANPQRVGGYDTSGSAMGVAGSGNYAYVGDGTNGLEVIDVSSPANPQRVGGYDTSGSAQGVAVSGNYAYVAEGACWLGCSGGLDVIDVS